MSVAGKSVGDATPTRAYQPVGFVDPTTGVASAPGTDINGNRVRYNADGTPYQPTYQLATAQTLAGSAASTPVTNVTGGSYIYSAIFGGTSPSLKLQSLAADGVTYVDIGAADTTSPVSRGVVIGQGATVRLLNTTANAITGLSASLT